MLLIFLLTCLVLQDGLRAPEESVEKQEEKKKSHKKVVYEEAEGMYIDEEQKVRHISRVIMRLQKDVHDQEKECHLLYVLQKRQEEGDEEYEVRHLDA